MSRALLRKKRVKTFLSDLYQFNNSQKCINLYFNSSPHKTLVNCERKERPDEHEVLLSHCFPLGIDEYSKKDIKNVDYNSLILLIFVLLNYIILKN